MTSTISNRRMILIIAFSMTMCTAVRCLADKRLSVRVDSPDKQLAIVLSVRPTKQRRVYYSVQWRGKAILRDSQLKLLLRNEPLLDAGFEITAVKMNSVDTSWKPVVGQRARIPDKYQQAVVQLVETHKPHRALTVTLRSYDQGVAFRYRVGKRDNGNERTVLEEEYTEFCFPEDHPAWVTYSAQGKYAKMPISRIKRGCERPLTIQAGTSRFIAIGEAALVDYARMKLSRSQADPLTLVSELAGPVESKRPLVSPWRFIMVGETPGELLENNFLILNLNEPCRISDTSWIKPGKVIREVTLSTQGGKACVDFAASHNLQYVEYDAGWYGHEYDATSDATTVTVDPKRSHRKLDLPEVIQYAEKKGIGIIVYVNRLALERQLDTILPLYQEWGIKGVKYGFVRVGSQQWTAWLHTAVRKAAQHKLMIDVHDEYRPTGYSRTYPNFMTHEGIRGDEARPSNEQTLTTLFTRMIAGAGDNTVCYFSSRVGREIGSHASQLAKTVCLYSPWQFLYWYDKPIASISVEGPPKNLETVITEVPELDFFNNVPTVWDEIRVVEGEIGRFATIARKRKERWFVGSMNGPIARRFKIRLEFLDKNRNYTATIYSDDPTVDTRTHVNIQRVPVTRETILEADIAPDCGQAIMIIPSKD